MPSRPQTARREGRTCRKSFPRSEFISSQIEVKHLNNSKPDLRQQPHPIFSLAPQRPPCPLFPSLIGEKQEPSWLLQCFCDFLHKNLHPDPRFLPGPPTKANGHHGFEKWMHHPPMDQLKTSPVKDLLEKTFRSRTGAVFREQLPQARGPLRAWVDQVSGAWHKRGMFPEGADRNAGNPNSQLGRHSGERCRRGRILTQA